MAVTLLFLKTVFTVEIHISLPKYSIPAPDIPPNSHKALRSDPALIEDTAFNHMRNLSGDGRCLACACACEDQLGGLCVLDGFKLAGF
ncbi:MAG: hypothetical protein L6282_05680 [Candidatus Methanoperedenaceae archaeon]|nr:hypothetical protein [Candidatus Methanoperedenaceae archaeon]